MKLFSTKFKDVELYWMQWDYMKLCLTDPKEPGLIGRGEMFYDCPHVYYNCLFFQIWISGF